MKNLNKYDYKEEECEGFRVYIKDGNRWFHLQDYPKGQDFLDLASYDAFNCVKTGFDSYCIVSLFEGGNIERLSDGTIRKAHYVA